MLAMTSGEVQAFIEKHAWATGLRVEHGGRTDVYYDTPGADCIELAFPEKPMQLSYFARVVSLLNLDREELFNGAVLWLTLQATPSAAMNSWI